MSNFDVAMPFIFLCEVKTIRNREITIRFRVNEKEEKLIKQKFEHSAQSSLSDFIRRMVLTGNIIHLDLKPIDEIASLLRICSNNINQIAKRMNSYEYVGKSDIQYLRDLHEKLFEMMKALSEKIETL